MINAHYTDPAIAAEVWQALQGLGFEGGQVLEPGSGAGTFIGRAPEPDSPPTISQSSATRLLPDLTRIIGLEC